MSITEADTTGVKNALWSQKKCVMSTAVNTNTCGNSHVTYVLEVDGKMPTEVGHGA